MAEMIDFELPKISPSIIMVTGVGGGGSNAVNHMYELGIADVSFMVCNTDRQALYRSPVPIKVRLGENLTQGLGAGNNPERGREAAMESLDEITEIYKREGTRMVFITAGMGGGTGTGAAPVIAKAAKSLGILTVAIVTLPFRTEGKKRMHHAYDGIDELKEYVDSLLLINNESIQEIYGKLTLTEAFGKADDILATAAKSIAEIITREYTVNVDFADVQTVMKDSGIALMGSARAAGEDRAMDVANAALSSPLLNHNDINGARNILINITSGDDEITLEETYLITEYIQERAGNNADIIWGAGNDPALGGDIEVTIIATGFEFDTMSNLGQVRRSPLQTQLDQMVRREAENETVVGDSPQDDTVATEDGEMEIRTKPRVKWAPPAEASPNIYPSFNRPRVAEHPLNEGETPPPQMNFPMQPPVIEGKTRESDLDIDEYENVPSWVRRNMKFVKDNPEDTGRSSRVVLKDDQTAEDKKPSENVSLFD